MLITLKESCGRTEGGGNRGALKLSQRAPEQNLTRAFRVVIAIPKRKELPRECGLSASVSARIRPPQTLNPLNACGRTHYSTHGLRRFGIKLSPRWPGLKASLLQKLHLDSENGEAMGSRVILSADRSPCVRLKMPKTLDRHRKRGIPSSIRLDSTESLEISTRPHGDPG